MTFNNNLTVKCDINTDECGFWSLPDEILGRIFSYIKPKKIYDVSLVCRNFYAVLKSDFTLRRLFVHDLITQQNANFTQVPATPQPHSLTEPIFISKKLKEADLCLLMQQCIKCLSVLGYKYTNLGLLKSQIGSGETIKLKFKLDSNNDENQLEVRQDLNSASCHIAVSLQCNDENSKNQMQTFIRALRSTKFAGSLLPIAVTNNKIHFAWFFKTPDQIQEALTYFEFKYRHMRSIPDKKAIDMSPWQDDQEMCVQLGKFFYNDTVDSHVYNRAYFSPFLWAYLLSEEGIGKIDEVKKTYGCLDDIETLNLELGDLQKLSEFLSNMRYGEAYCNDQIIPLISLFAEVLPRYFCKKGINHRMLSDVLAYLLYFDKSSSDLHEKALAYTKAIQASCPEEAARLYGVLLPNAFSDALSFARQIPRNQLRKRNWKYYLIEDLISHAQQPADLLFLVCVYLNGRPSIPYVKLIKMLVAKGISIEIFVEEYAQYCDSITDLTIGKGRAIFECVCESDAKDSKYIDYAFNLVKSPNEVKQALGKGILVAAIDKQKHSARIIHSAGELCNHSNLDQCVTGEKLVSIILKKHIWDYLSGTHIYPVKTTAFVREEFYSDLCRIAKTEWGKRILTGHVATYGKANNSKLLNKQLEHLSYLCDFLSCMDEKAYCNEPQANSFINSLERILAQFLTKKEINQETYALILANKVPSYLEFFKHYAKDVLLYAERIQSQYPKEASEIRKKLQ